MLRRVLLLIAVMQARSLVGADLCIEKLPPTLRAAFGRAFPEYRQVLVSDYDAETIQSESAYHSGSPCLAVEPGDFNADKVGDYVFLALSAKDTVRAFVALGSRRGWRVRQLWDLGSTNPGCCYANTLPPGRYENFYGTEPDPDRPLAPDERLVLTSASQGAVVGAIESTGVAFFLVDNHWLHVWVAD